MDGTVSLLVVVVCGRTHLGIFILYIKDYQLSFMQLYFIMADFFL